MDEQPQFDMQPIDDDVLKLGRRHGHRKWHWYNYLLAAAGLVALILFAAYGSYRLALQPVDSDSDSKQTIKIESGMSPQDIAEALKHNRLIKSVWSFRIYAKLHSVQDRLQAGVYDLKRSQSTPDIIAALHSGKGIRMIDVTFLPGSTLEEVRAELEKVGFSRQEIDSALNHDYDIRLFDTKPSNSGLEGYIFGETHRFTGDVSAEEVLAAFFADYQEFIDDNNLIAAYKKQGLTLFEGITLASIVQREASSGDEAQIAQVFLLRLKKDIVLGSDVTYQYIADKQGVERNINLDSPYNTRRYKGLPPGPIASPGKKALLAVAHPAKGNYLYFVYGDDGKAHFSRTEDQHNENARKYCHKLCQEM